MHAAPARYFPVRPGRYRMRAGLHPFGADFGNGPADALHFQVDRNYRDYLAAKRRALREEGSPPVERRAVIDDGPESAGAHRAVLRWLHATVLHEWPELAGEPCLSGADFATRYDALLRKLQEDAVVIQRNPGSHDRAIGVHVCFPSSWRPDRIAGHSFQQIHEPVPGFAETPASAARMLRAMIDRGPHVRFVWTVSADSELDHHPDEGGRTAFGLESREGWLRVERQVTVPFPAVNAALFLIRVYRYPFASLEPSQQRDLHSALRAMPDPVQRYKGLAGQIPHALAVLERSAS